MKTETFNKLPISQKKVLIATDVLKQIKAKKYIAKRGYYVDAIIYNGDYHESVKENFKKLRNCTVCAMGSILVSTTNFKNVLTFDDIDIGSNENSHAWDLLKDIFEPKEIHLIENCFEGFDENGCRVAFGRFNMPEDTSVEEVADSYKNKFNDSEKRLISIMKNIIRNKGKFIPQQDIK